MKQYFMSGRRTAYFAGVILFVVAGAGTIFIVKSHAVTPDVSIEAEAGTASGNADTVSDDSASGSSAARFGANSQTGTCPSTTADTPDGPDLWGGCWPGPATTGYPHGLPGDTRTPVTLTDYTGDCTIRTDNTTIDSKLVDCDGMLMVYAKNLTIKDSKVNATIYLNSETASLNISDSEVDGQDQATFPTIGGANNVTALRVNAYGGEHTIHCYGNCSVTDSYLHDNYDASAQGAHQNGFLSNSGSTFTIHHNSVGCVGGCTADIAFLSQPSNSDATVTNNLLLASPDASYCVYPGPDSSDSEASNMVWKNNVFQRGTVPGDHGNPVCGYYGPVYGWFPEVGTGNVWSNNTWDDGAPINP